MSEDEPSWNAVTVLPNIELAAAIDRPLKFDLAALERLTPSVPAKLSVSARSGQKPECGWVRRVPLV